MSPFDPIKLSWDGKDYAIPADRVLKAIAIVEDIVSLREMAVAAQKGNPPLAKISMAYAALLQYAGADASKVTADAVYAGMFSDQIEMDRVALAVVALMQLMIPRHALPNSGAKPGNELAGEVKSSPEAYKAAVGGKWVASPADFWSLTPYEFWLLWDYHRPRKVYGKGKGAMTEAELEEIYQDEVAPLKGE